MFQLCDSGAAEMLNKKRCYEPETGSIAIACLARSSSPLRSTTHSLCVYYIITLAKIV